MNEGRLQKKSTKALETFGILKFSGLNLIVGVDAIGPETDFTQDQNICMKNQYTIF